MEEGWKRRMVASEPRLTEVKEMYESLGFEVRLGPVGPDDPYWDEEDCTACFENPEGAKRTKVVYTRQAGNDNPVDGEDDLFE